jgi:hypothetical protein
LWLLAVATTEDQRLKAAVLILASTLAALLLLAAIMHIRFLARKWNSPMFYPTIWASIFFIPAAWTIFGLLNGSWEARETTCFGDSCTTSRHFDLTSLIFALVFSGVVLLPFAHAVVKMYLASRVPPPRFVCRRRCLHLAAKR